MTGKERNESRQVDTGGGLYIGGDVNVGRDLIGRDHIEVHVTRGATVEQFRELLAQIRQELQGAGLERELAQLIEAEVRLVEEQTRKEAPDKAIVISKLHGIREALQTTASAATITTAGVELAPLVERAIQWAQQLF